MRYPCEFCGKFNCECNMSEFQKWYNKQSSTTRYYDFGKEKQREAYEAGYAAGQKAMQGFAATAAEELPVPGFGSDDKWDGYSLACEDAADAIRAIPVGVATC